MRPRRLHRPAIALALGAAAIASSLVPAAAGGSPAAPKNVIVFVVDGMAAEQIELGRRVNGGPLTVERIPWQTKGSLDTTSLDGTTDSAAGATALASGVETHNGWVGTYPRPSGGVAIAETALEQAEDVGKATGLISDSYITDATPAGFAAHVTSRSQTEEIAGQMAEQGIEFLLGGGRRQGSVGSLLRQPGVSYVWTADQLDGYVEGGGDGPVYGFFGSWNMAYNLDREEEGVARKDPTLPEMTAAALSVLSQDPQGFFLMVEGGLVDWSGHARDGASLGSEMIETDEAVRVAWEWAQGRDDTLILFTADHETGDLAVSSATDVAALRRQRATTEFMWGEISDGASISSTLSTYARITPTAAEIDRVRRCGEHGISDVLADRWNVSWGWRCTDEGEHTDTYVPAWAWGPGSAGFGGAGIENEVVGQHLLSLLGA
jgi:alkaline phosphatase